MVFILEFEEKKFLCHTKNCLCLPPLPVTLLWRRACPTLAFFWKKVMFLFVTLHQNKSKKKEVQTWKMGGRIKGTGQVNKSRESQQNVVYSKTLFRFLKTRQKMQHIIKILCFDFFSSTNRSRDIDQNIAMNEAWRVQNLSSAKSAAKAKDQSKWKITVASFVLVT